MSSDDELALRSDEALFATQVLRELARDVPDPERMLGLLGRIFGADTVAVFGGNEHCLSAWGAAAERAHSAAITGDPFRAVEAARQSREAALVGGDEAWPLAGRDGEVLYLHQPARSTPLKRELFGRHLSHFLTLSERQQRSAGALEQSRLLGERLMANQEITRRTLSALTQIGSHLQLDLFLREFGRAIRAAVPYTHGYLVATPSIQPLEATSPLEPAQEEALLVAGRLETDRVLLLAELGSTPYQPLSTLGTSLLAAPLVQSGERVGALVLLNGTPYDHHHRTAAEFCAGHLATALSFAQLHQQMQQAQAEVAQAGRLSAVGQMAAGLAHEINNPLGSIVLALDTVQRFVESKPKVAVSVLGEALAAAERAQTIVRKMLHFSRDSRQGFRQVGCGELLDDIALVIQPQLREREAELEVRKPEPDFEIYGNPGELAQVAVNLLLNALDAGQNPVVLKISVERDVEDWLLSVEDHGPGVPSELRERIFEPFFTTKEVGQGTGLGLHVSRQIVEAHGGTLALLPSQQGALFQARLPVHKRPQNSTA